MINAGDLTERLTLQAETKTYDSYNQPVLAYSDITNVWAQVIMSGGREFYAAQKLNAETSAVFRIRRRNGMNSRMRIKWGNRYFDILSIAEPDRSELLISGKEVV